LRQRIAIFAHYLGMKQIALESHSIVPQFSRGLPKNLLEISQIVNNLEGKVTNRQLISLLPFVEDPDAELEALEEEKKKNMEDMPMFNQDNTKPEDEVEDEESGVLVFMNEIARVRETADRLNIDEPMYILAGTSSTSIQNNIIQELYNMFDIE
ncbi:phage portal protein, partial [Streptococcus pneumoniae]|uniref:phage portal protein n=1 Tax=Streptococcus pneumoniae TaxID=1313 RepID=UPI001EFD282F